jgi:Protein of unknown function (DUF3592)
MNTLFPSLLSLVFIATGAVIISYAIRTAAKARQSPSWPSIEGEIAHSAVQQETNTTATGYSTTYKADISYRYKVNGTNYSSTKVSHVTLSTSATSRAQGIVQKYPDKSRVQVYYNPSDPSEAVLEPGNTDGIDVLYGLGGIFCAGGFIFLVLRLTGQIHQ